jgi:hypothetical protein
MQQEAPVPQKVKSEKTFRLERDLEAACGRLSAAAGWFHRKYKGPGRRAHPDRLFAKGGRAVWIEFKLPGCAPTPLQWLEISAMRAAGLEVHVIDNIADFEAVLHAE